MVKSRDDSKRKLRVLYLHMVEQYPMKAIVFETGTPYKRVHAWLTEYGLKPRYLNEAGNKAHTHPKNTEELRTRAARINALADEGLTWVQIGLRLERPWISLRNWTVNNYPDIADKVRANKVQRGG